MNNTEAIELGVVTAEMTGFIPQCLGGAAIECTGCITRNTTGEISASMRQTIVDFAPTCQDDVDRRLRIQALETEANMDVLRSGDRNR